MNIVIDVLIKFNFKNIVVIIFECKLKVIVVFLENIGFFFFYLFGIVLRVNEIFLILF